MDTLSLLSHRKVFRAQTLSSVLGLDVCWNLYIEFIKVQMEIIKLRMVSLTHLFSHFLLHTFVAFRWWHVILIQL